MSYTRAREFIVKITKMLSDVNSEGRRVTEPEKKVRLSPRKRIAFRTKSLSSKQALLEYLLINQKQPVSNLPQLPAKPASQAIQERPAKVKKLYKPMAQLHSVTKQINSTVISYRDEGLGKYQKMLSLTQKLIGQDSLKGWN